MCRDVKTLLRKRAIKEKCNMNSAALKITADKDSPFVLSLCCHEYVSTLTSPKSLRVTERTKEKNDSSTNRNNWILNI